MQLFQQSFVTGEISPGLRIRSSWERWRSAAGRIENMIVHYQGGVSNRAGTQYVGPANVNSDDVRLIPFVFNTDQTYVLVFTPGFVQIVTQGAFLESSPGVPLTLGTPYTAANLPGLRFAQWNDILTLTHPNHPAAEIRRLGVTSWTYTLINFGAGIAAPTGVTSATQGVTPPGTPTPQQRSYSYAVTAVRTSTADESLRSASTAVTNFDLGYNQQNNTANLIAWNAVTGADYYNVYRFYQGVWAFIGSTVATGFTDVNTLPDTATTPPEADVPFDGGNHPTSVSFYQQRRVFGGAALTPTTLYFTRSGNFNSFNSSQPLRPDDPVTALIAARDTNAIRHMIPLRNLLVLTGGGAWSITGQNGVITPADVLVENQAYVGASLVTPAGINYDVIYARERGVGITALSYDFNAQGYTPRDITALAAHLFTGNTVRDMAYAAEPHKILWTVRNDGRLLGLTYLREQEVLAWHQHSTQGRVLAVASVGEGREDVLYLAVRRPIGAGGAEVLVIERMMPRAINDPAPDVRYAWHVDCGLRYEGAPATIIGGLAHLNGKEVAILADGNVVPPQVVSGGQITLPRAASVVTVGLAYTSTLETLPIDAAQAPLQGRRKRVHQLRVFLENTRGLEVALLDGAQFVKMKERTWERWGDPTRLITGSREIVMPNGWDLSGSLALRQRDPLPVTVLAVMPDVEVGEFG